MVSLNNEDVELGLASGLYLVVYLVQDDCRAGCMCFLEYCEECLFRCESSLLS